MLFQIVCFHVAAGAAIFAGTMSEQTHHRARWILLCCYFIITALYLRAAWGLRLVPPFVTSPLAQIFFYPALTPADIGTAAIINQWSLCLLQSNPSMLTNLWQPMAYVLSFGIGALASLSLVLRSKANIFETAIERADEKLLGRAAFVGDSTVGRALCPVRVAPQAASFPSLPRHSTLDPRLLLLFRGVGAIIWKNLVVASRSKREILLAAGFTFIYTGFLIALRVILHRLMAEGGDLPARDLRDFDNGLASMLVGLTFFLQRSFPFDFRRDGHHLVGFRTLPISPLALAFAEISVPTLFCLAFQAVAVLALMLCGRFEWLLLLVMLLGFPAVALGLNSVWNVHYLMASSKRAGGKAESASSVTILMVVALSFLIFYPAGWAAVEVGRRVPGPICEPIGISVWLAVQYLVDFCLLLLLAKLFQRFEVSDEIR
jgi:hypothetical protein